MLLPADPACAPISLHYFDLGLLAASESLGAGSAYTAMLIPADRSCAHLLCAHVGVHVKHSL